MSGFFIASLRSIAVGVILLLGGGYARAQQFSAQLAKTATLDGKTAAVGRLFVQGAKVRIEASEFPDGYFVVDASRGDASFVRPAARVYMAAKQSTWLTRAFVAVNPEDPCLQWQSAAIVAGVTDQDTHLRCEMIGHEVVGGRETMLFRARSGSSKEFLGWIDPRLTFPLRVRMGGTTIEVEEMEEGPQPAQLFEIPPSYKRFDPNDLIKRIKQSDVWVQEPAPE